MDSFFLGAVTASVLTVFIFVFLVTSPRVDWRSCRSHTTAELCEKLVFNYGVTK